MWDTGVDASDWTVGRVRLARLLDVAVIRLVSKWVDQHPIPSLSFSLGGWDGSEWVPRAGPGEAREYPAPIGSVERTSTAPGRCRES